MTEIHKLIQFLGKQIENVKFFLKLYDPDDRKEFDNDFAEAKDDIAMLKEIRGILEKRLDDEFVKCANCGIDIQFAEKHIVGGTLDESEWTCSDYCYEQIDELGCPLEGIDGKYRKRQEAPLGEGLAKWFDKRVTQLAFGLPENQWKYSDKQKAKKIRKLLQQRKPKKPTITREIIKAIKEDIDSGVVDETYLIVVFRDIGVEVVEEGGELKEVKNA